MTAVKDLEKAEWKKLAHLAAGREGRADWSLQPEAVGEAIPQEDCTPLCRAPDCTTPAQWLLWVGPSPWAVRSFCWTHAHEHLKHAAGLCSGSGCYKPATWDIWEGAAPAWTIIPVCADHADAHLAKQPLPRIMPRRAPRDRPGAAP